MLPDIHRLLIISHVMHYHHAGKIYAYAPYAREIEIWADLFADVRIAAPCSEAVPPGDCSPLSRSNIELVPIRDSGGAGIRAKAKQIASLPSILWSLHKAMLRVDAVHVRCPGNLGLLGVILAPLYSRYLVAKYAGQWTSFPGEPLSVRLQKKVLASRWWKGPTTIYGKYEGQPDKVVSFFTSMMDSTQMEAARAAALRRRSQGSLRVLFVGRLSMAKNPGVVVEAVANLRREGINATAVIVGEGPERAALERLCNKLNIADQVDLAGGMPFDRVLRLYGESDAIVLASETEGWPKVVAEAMAFGLVCVASDRGFVREMLGDGRGVLVEPGNVEGVTRELRALANCPEEYLEMRRKAAEWSQRCSLEGLRDAVEALLSERWSSPKRAAMAGVRTVQG